MAFERPITVAKVIDEIQSNRYILPAIQREFVWDTEQIENLFDSMMKGYPIGLSPKIVFAFTPVPLSLLC